MTRLCSIHNIGLQNLNKILPEQTFTERIVILFGQTHFNLKIWFWDRVLNTPTLLISSLKMADLVGSRKPQLPITLAHVEQNWKKRFNCKRCFFLFKKKTVFLLLFILYSLQTKRSKLTLNHIILCKMRSCTHRAHTCLSLC